MSNACPKDGSYPALMSGHEVRFKAPDLEGRPRRFKFTNPNFGVRGRNIPETVTVQNGKWELAKEV